MIANGATVSRTRGAGGAGSVDLRVALVAAWCRQQRLPEPVAEYRFAPPRRWRFDLAFVNEKIALEIDGPRNGLKLGGHQHPAGLANDRAKDRAALALGWKVVRVTTRQFTRGDHWGLLEQLLRSTKGVDDGQER
jgi:very-short-patch-repair endonuclease